MELPIALGIHRGDARTGGWFFWGQYGGIDRGAIFADGEMYEPKRFFSYVGDGTMLAIASEHFDVIDFHAVEVGGEPGTHFQAQP